MRFSNAVALAVIAAIVTPSEAHAIPAWARKYNMNCSGCHYPAPPRLNAAGLRFRWAGYRMPEEIGEAATVTQISNYISARGQVAFNFQKQTGQSAETAFDAEEATLFYGGPFGKNFTGWFEFERGMGGEFGLASQVGGVWGGEHSYRGFKVGMGHWLANVGIAGFDRMVGFSQPLPLEGPVTAAVPFQFAGDRSGGEVFWATERNRISALVLDPIPGAGGEISTRKDFAVTDQLILDKRGGGIMFAGYFGSQLGVDTSATTVRSSYWRVAVSASRVFGNVEVLGGAVLARDSDLPVGGSSPFVSDQMKGSGYWASGQYFVPNSKMTLFGRYEFVDPNTDVAADGVRRYVLGSVLPLTLPEYLHATVEYTLLKPQASGAPSTNGLAAGFWMAF